eukprot:1161301-Pelagomonas_calceolata.AAC.19
MSQAPGTAHSTQCSCEPQAQCTAHSTQCSREPQARCLHALRLTMETRPCLVRYTCAPGACLAVCYHLRDGACQALRSARTQANHEDAAMPGEEHVVLA